MKIFNLRVNSKFFKIIVNDKMKVGSGKCIANAMEMMGYDRCWGTIPSCNGQTHGAIYVESNKSGYKVIIRRYPK